MPQGLPPEGRAAESGWSITGFTCPRGKEYGENEMTHPTRVITSTVKISGACYPRLPVKTASPIPKEMIGEAMKLLDGIELASPIRRGDVIVADICKTGIPFIASRDM